MEKNMRIEKVNENQIRCYLTKEDMEARKLHLKELAYGTEKARLLFHELMQQAYSRFGFEAENMPVMIEAVPLHDESLVLIVTKVDNPEELDTRFSSFAPSVKSGGGDEDKGSSSVLGQLLDTIRRELGEDTAASGPQPSGKGAPSGSTAPSSAPSPEGKTGPDTSLTTAAAQLYTFPSIGLAADAACMAAPAFSGVSSLYRDTSDGKYYLILSPKKDGSTAGYTRALSIFSEFGTSEYLTPAREQYLREHCDILSIHDAVERLAELGG